MNHNTTRKLALYGAILSSLLAVGLAVDGAKADASPQATGPGDQVGACTVAATGHYQGKAVFLTAAHCTPTVATGSAGGAGSVVGIGWDWVLVETDGVGLHNTLPDGRTLTATGGQVPGEVCQYSRRAGATVCSDAYQNNPAQFGDSGGPVFQGSTLIGIISSNRGYSALPEGFTLG